ncbi:MAG TPA: hypothetical protein VFV43_00150 [Limnobacter sp.]|nr:hypothetical protein [Limnobacter sp.]
MMLALPIQGMAQASMFACHLSGEEMGKQVTAHHVGMDHGDAGHQAMGHQAMGHPDMDHSAHSTDGDNSSGGQVIKSLHGCCNCAPSCAAVVLPNSPSKFGAVQQASQVLLPVQLTHHSADLRRIDRPPKNLAI